MNVDNVSKERLADLFRYVLNEILNGAEPWYQKELISNLGITREEAEALDVAWIFEDEEAEYNRRVRRYSEKYKKELDKLKELIGDHAIKVTVDDEYRGEPGFNISINDNEWVDTFYGYEYAAEEIKRLIGESEK